MPVGGESVTRKSGEGFDGFTIGKEKLGDVSPAESERTCDYVLHFQKPVLVSGISLQSRELRHIESHMPYKPTTYMVLNGPITQKTSSGVLSQR